jgi:hypothetical protein
VTGRPARAYDGRMRTVATLGILVTAAVLSLASAQPQQAAGPPTPYGQDPTGCDLACNHYLECKGIHDDGLYSQCIGGCQQEGVNRVQSQQYAQLDCASAIQLVESQGGVGGGGAQAGGGGETGVPHPGDKACEGCKKWDEQCAYIVETAVGSGPYSGAVTDCAPTCCP